MAAAAIHVIPDDSFEDWIVRGEVGQDIGHFPTREEAEQLAEAIARGHQTDLVVHLPDGRTSRKSVKKSWVARLLGR
jgi:hypothetical protein